MAAGHTVVSREERPVRRSGYEGGTVSYDVEEHGHKVRLTIRADGAVVHRLDGARRGRLLHEPV